MNAPGSEIDMKICRTIFSFEVSPQLGAYLVYIKVLFLSVCFPVDNDHLAILVSRFGSFFPTLWDCEMI